MQPPVVTLLLAALALLLVFDVAPTCSSAPAPLNCTEAGRVCTSFLSYKTGPNATVALLRSMFDASLGDLTADTDANPGYVFVRKNCSCLYGGEYVANTTFTVRQEESSVYPLVAEAYAGLAYLPDAGKRAARAGAVVWLHLLCGCSSGLWNYLMSYVAEAGDTVESLSSRFGVSMDSIETANGMQGPNALVVGDVYYIPLDSVPGQAFVDKADTSPSPTAAPQLKLNTSSEIPHHGSTKFPYGWVFGSMGVTFILIIVALLCASCNFFNSRKDIKGSDQSTPHKFHVLQSTSFCYGSGRYFCCKSANPKSSMKDSGNHQTSMPKGVVGDTFEMEKPIVFKHEEILSATNSFSDASLLGHGTYGSVYYGILHNQEVAIKRMTATKTKEFMVEMKVLCKVHHASLVELIGYAVSDNELFLIYEYVHKGALKNHLHDPQSKGHTSLNWISRVQIALDTARGLEYIHEHTKNHYIHRDIKTSNILLDSSYRAKISDFGLAKLVIKTSEGEASATKVVGTFGYLAPEYLCEGTASPKTDVYAFGVVLFELISGKESITRTKGSTLTSTERRSLASIMLAALRNSSNSLTMVNLKDYIDPNLMGLYPPDCVCKMAMLANQCVDEDPTLRPDMKQAVISLSQILLSSVEWEATLAGNSQVFSGLVQGR